MTGRTRAGGGGKDQITSRMKVLLNYLCDHSRGLGALESSSENFFSDMDKGRANLAIGDYKKEILGLFQTSVETARREGYLEGRSDAITMDFLRLTPKGRRKFVEALLSPPPPNQALLDAKALYEGMMGGEQGGG